MEATETVGLPSGTVTFLFTDIEGSSERWERSPESMGAALASHDRLVAEVVAAHGGAVVKHLGDGCWAVFPSAPRAAAAAVEFQRRHQAATDDDRVPVRIGLHTGDVDPTGHDYFGPVVNRAARVVDLANGDQIVCSSATAALLDGFDVRSDGLHELRGIGTEEVHLLRAPGVRTASRPLREAVVPSNLPTPRTSLVGRHDDVDRVLAHLGGADAVVTLLGPGGVGKTRLAIEAARRLRGEFADRVHFCDLVPLTDPADVADSVAEVVGARRQPGMDLVGSIADHLSGRHVLVVLDNCEHVADAVAALVDRLADADDVHILATSRSALGVAGEVQIHVDPLPPSSTGLELFVERARSCDDQFTLDDENAAAVRSIVDRVEGIPLAIELAAARVRLLAPQELDERLAHGFDLLGVRRRGTRHDTLADTVRWSYDLLAPAEQRLFERMSVFAGGFGLDAVEAVCAGGDVEAVDVPDLVMSLIDQSMVAVEEVDGHRRYRLLETLRRFAAAELAGRGELDARRERHAAHYLSLAIEQNDRLFGPTEPEVWRILDVEWDNLRAARDTFEELGDVDRGAELVVALTWYAAMAMRFELFGWADALLDVDGIGAHPAYADLCGVAAVGAYFTVDDRVTSLAAAGLDVDPSDPNGFCRCALASVFLNNVHTAGASDELTSAWLASEPATTGNRIWAHAFRTFHLCIHDPTPEAREHATTVERIAEQTGSVTARAVAAWAMGQVRTFDDVAAGADLWNEGREWARAMSRPHLVDHLLVGLLLHVSVRRGELGSILADCRAAVQQALDDHYHVGTSHLFGVTAIALSRAGDPETGARLVGSMIAKGHLPRRNARHDLEVALGDRLEPLLEAGAKLGVTDAGRLALDALDAAMERSGTGR